MVNCGQGPWERCSARQSLAPSTAPKGRPQGTAQPETELGAPSFPVLIVPVNWQLMLCTQSSATAQLGGVRQSLPWLQGKPQLCPLPPVLAHTPCSCTQHNLGTRMPHPTRSAAWCLLPSLPDQISQQLLPRPPLPCCSFSRCRTSQFKYFFCKS